MTTPEDDSSKKNKGPSGKERRSGKDRRKGPADRRNEARREAFKGDRRKTPDVVAVVGAGGGVDVQDMDMLPVVRNARLGNL